MSRVCILEFNIFYSGFIELHMVIASSINGFFKFRGNCYLLIHLNKIKRKRVLMKTKSLQIFFFDMFFK